MRVYKIKSGHGNNIGFYKKNRSLFVKTAFSMNLFICASSFPLGELIIIKKRLDNNADWNTLVANGMYYTSGYGTSFTNAPEGAHLYGVLLVFSPIPNAILQIYTPDGNNPYVYMRVHNNAWTAWRKFDGINL